MNQSIRVIKITSEPHQAFSAHHSLTPKSNEANATTVLTDKLLVSAMSQFELPGGLFLVEPGMAPLVTVIDRLPSAGLSASDGVIVRGINNPHHMILNLYTPTNVGTIASEKYRDVHDVRYEVDQCLVVSTGTNEVVLFDVEGVELGKWSFPGPKKDAWHINCVDLWDGRYVVSCFGQMYEERDLDGDWSEKGVVFDLETRDVIWSGLTMPHTPRMDSVGRQFVCDSGKFALLARSDFGAANRVEFPGAFPRGLAFGTNHIYVGLSTIRPKYRAALDVQSIPCGRIVVLDKNSLDVLGFVEIPCAEIYDIVVLPVEAATNVS